MIEAFAYYGLIIFAILSAFWMIENKVNKYEREQINNNAIEWHKKTTGRDYEYKKYRKASKKGSKR
jgi:uncharacterized membrane protein